MSQREHEKPIGSLHAKRAEVVETLAALDLADRPVQLDQSRQGRLSRMDAMTQQEMAKAGRAHLALELRRIEAALARADAATYGLCCRCHAAIDPPRLEADPAAPFCMDCVEEIAEERAEQGRLDRR